MFEVGFTEIVLILGLALLVLGPEKLPKLAAQIGRWTGRARSMARQLRAQLDQEVNFQEKRAAHGRGETTPAKSPAPEPSGYPPASMEPDPPAQTTASASAHPVAETGTEAVSGEPAVKPSNE
jgi:sec-independent protein translocase protein TatB